MGNKFSVNQKEDILIQDETNEKIKGEDDVKVIVSDYIALLEEEIEVIRDVLQEPNENCKWGILILSVLLYRVGIVKQECDDTKVQAEEYLEGSKQLLERLKQLDPDHYNRYEYLLRKY